MSSTVDTAAMLHRCGPAEALLPLGTNVKRLPFTTIDVHCHILTPAVDSVVAGHARKLTEMQELAEMLGPISSKVNQDQFSSLLPKLISVDARLQDMDAMGVDIQAISPGATQYYYWAEEDLACEIIRLQNDEIDRIINLYPKRFVGLGTVALQYPTLAARQLESLIRDRGFKGVQISTLVEGMDIADPHFDPFWAKAEELGAVIFIHPWGTTLGKRVSEHYLMNTIGQPFETTVCLSKMIFGGTFDRFPKLKIIAAHGGGYLPLYASRSDHARAVRPEVNGCQCCPTEYLKRIWYDSVVYEPDHLARLIDAVGATRVLIGTDYPFDMGHYHPSALVAAFPTQTQRMVLGENAAALFGIST